MKKNKIRLTESQLQSVIKESVGKILEYRVWDDSAYDEEALEYLEDEGDFETEYLVREALEALYRLETVEKPLRDLLGLLERKGDNGSSLKVKEFLNRLPNNYQIDNLCNVVNNIYY